MLYVVKHQLETGQAFEISVDDGTYRGIGQGFGGDLVVDVTVSGAALVT